MSSLEAIGLFLKKSLCTLLLETVYSVWEKSGEWSSVKGIDRSSNNFIN